MKRVLILTLSIGNGHKAKANALHDYLKDMDVKVIDIFSNKIKGNKIYLYCLNHKLWLCVKMIIKAKSVMDALYSLFYQSSLEEQILEYKPDTIINTTPMMSRALLNISKKHNLKYIIAPSDFNYMDLKHWGVPRNTDNFEYWIPYAFEEEKAFFAQNNIKISITGFIVDDYFKNEVNMSLGKDCYVKSYIMPNVELKEIGMMRKPFRSLKLNKDCMHKEIAEAMSEDADLFASTGGATINEILYVMNIAHQHGKKYKLCLVSKYSDIEHIINYKYLYHIKCLIEQKQGKLYVENVDFECLRKHIFIIETKRTKALYWEQANVDFLSKYMKYENLIGYDLRCSVIRKKVIDK